MRMFPTLFAAAATAMTSPVFGQEGVEPVPLPDVSDGLWPAMMKLAVAVIVIVALIYVSMIVMRKFTLGKSGILGGKGSLEVLERSYFAPKKFVCLMRVGEKVLLLGVSESNVNLVADVSDQNFSAPVKNGAREKGSPFRTYLQQARSHLSTLTSKL